MPVLAYFDVYVLHVTRQRNDPHMKPVYFVGSSLADLTALPLPVQKDIGFALYEAQLGGKSFFAKSLQGFGSSGVLEVVEDHDGDAYRAVYTVKFKRAVYVLHVFQKKSKRGAETPKRDMDLVRARLKVAEALEQERRLKK
jgi:phage-related protein